MPIVMPPMRWAFKPPTSCQELDRDHPHIQGAKIVAAPEAGTFVDALGNPFTQGTQITVVPGKYGPAMRYNANFCYSTNPIVAVPTTACTILTILRSNNSASTGSAFGSMDTATDRIQAHIPYSGTIYWDYGGAAAPYRISWTPPGGWFGVWHTLAFRAGPAGMSIFSDGIKVANTATANPGHASGLPGWRLGEWSGARDDIDMESFILSNRELADATILAWTANPYAHFLPPVSQRFVPYTAAGGGGTTYPVPLTGTLTTSGAAISRLTGKPFSGALTTTGSAVVRQVARTFAGSLSLTGALTRRMLRSLAGALTLVSGPVAAIHAILISLAGTLSLTGAAIGRRTGKSLAGALTLAGGAVSAIGSGGSAVAAFFFRVFVLNRRSSR